MWIAAVLSCIGALIGGDLSAPDAYVWMGVVVTALFASAAAFFIQTAAQRHIGPTRTAVILVSEPAFAGLFGFLLLDERLTGRGWAGAGLILVGMLAAELWPRRP
jgi:drug/metabolite transporter (DMT)-like permease